MTHREYQRFIARKIRTTYGLPVKTEWRSMKEQPGLYCPTIDIAVGSFVYDATCIPGKHDQEIKQLEKPIKTMLDHHNKNVQRGPIFEAYQMSFQELCSKNKTARCLLAIEVEDTSNRKHLMGAIFNAIALGRVGIVVASTPDNVTAFTRIRHYIWFLQNATDLYTTNLLILDREQLANALTP
jgi:hypothetical protein